jgi:hypothetical protein
MANAIQTKLQKISGEYSAKVQLKRDLEAKKKKPFIKDAEIKTINEQIKVLDREASTIMTKLNNLTKIAKTAEEYLDLNKKLKELEASIAKAETRGESTVSFKQQRTGATSRLKEISGEVELNFPEIKVTPPKIVVTTKKPLVTTKKPVVTTPKPGIVTTPKPGTVTTPKPGTVTTPKPGTVTTPKPGTVATPSSLQTLLDKTDFWYDLPDYIFKVDIDPKTGQPGEIGRLLIQAVDEGWENKDFLSKLQLTKWWQRNSSNLRERIINREKYKDLRAAGENVDNTEYGLYLKKQIGSIKAKAFTIAGVTLTDEQAQSVAEKIYDGFLDEDPLAINALIVPFIGKVTSIVGTGTGAKSITAYSGQALQAYQTLQSIAKANGFSLKDILPGISTSTTGGDLEQAVLQGLAAGTIDINRVAQDTRVLASQGQPQYVRNLLSQGYDLENVYAPYRKQMATELEINPDMIDLNDPTLRSAITDKGDMNLFDFKRTLRQDNRWQYTQSARDEVSSGALKVLQDFGFMG